MRVFVGIIMGLFSGTLIYLGSSMLFIDRIDNSATTTIFVLITFIGGWVVSTYLIVGGTNTVSKVFSRGFLIGAAEWLAMIPIGFIVGSKTITSYESSEELAGAALGGGLVALFTTGVAIAMALVCLIGFAVSHFLGREMKPEVIENTKKCPQCAETIKAEAIKCRYCGADQTIT